MTDARLVRRATLRLGALAAVLLVAGLLPWVTGGSTAARVVGVPLLLAGAGVAAVGLRVRSVLSRRAAAASPAPLVERGCAGCACGAAGGCSVLESTSDTSATGTSAGDPAAAGAATDGAAVAGSGSGGAQRRAGQPAG